MLHLRAASGKKPYKCYIQGLRQEKFYIHVLCLQKNLEMLTDFYGVFALSINTEVKPDLIDSISLSHDAALIFKNHNTMTDLFGSCAGQIFWREI